MNITFTYGPIEEAGTADATVRFVTKAELEKEAAPIIQPQLDAAIRSSYAKGIFQAAPEQTEIMAALGLYSSSHVVFIGYREDAVTLESLRHSAAAAAKALKKLKADKAVMIIPETMMQGGAAFNTVEAAQAITEGLMLTLHDRQPLKREESERYSLKHVHFLPSDYASIDTREAQWKQGVERGMKFARGVAFARDLTNLPGNDLTPERLAENAEELARTYDLECEVLDEWSAAEQGMGGLLAVGQGSANPPRMIVLHYKGAPEVPEVWGLIGKGITFDTGGISLKKGLGMEEMISDMGGAAAVLGAMQIVGELKPAVNIIAVIPTAENMPSDRAYKPGDVIRMMSGHTVEVVNTDAEGRLVLADGLTTAIRRGATKLVDVATLTGAVLVALGVEATGAITNDERFLGELIAASERAGERVWQLPAYPEYRRQLKSDAADLKNSGGRYAGAITGGMFIGHFAESLPWIHLDIGGTAWLEAGRSWEPKGATGVMVRTLAELLTQNQQTVID